MPDIGIYQIVNNRTGRCYIGASVNIRRRWNEHRSRLRTGTHANHSLQGEWDAYGPEAFSWDVLQRVTDQEQLLLAEETHIRQAALPYNANERGGSGPRAGYQHTEASKLKMSRALKGRKKPDGFGALVSTWRRGVRLSADHRQAISEGLRGRVNSPETKAKRVASYKRAVERRRRVQAEGRMD